VKDETDLPGIFVLLVSQALHFNRQLAVELPEPLGREGLEGHRAPSLPLRRPTLLKRTEPTGAGFDAKANE
jgi:hypothetical protein